MYVEYTGTKVTISNVQDATFTVKKEKPEYLGILGPVVKAEVGDTIIIHFKNNLTIDCSVHPHGVFYAKSDEGFHYQDGTEGPKLSDSLPPGGFFVNTIISTETYTYVWPVPERSGPGPGEGSSVLWLYHSHTHEHYDINSGRATTEFAHNRNAWWNSYLPKGNFRFNYYAS